MISLKPCEMLVLLGSGASITSVCKAAGMTRSQFDVWWQEQCRRCVPTGPGPRLPKGCKIERDRWGIPHVRAGNDAELFFGFGYAVAQDRLFQLDYLRRKARGRLAEILGAEAVESDVLYRTIGLSHIAEAEWGQLPGETMDLLTAYTAGINAWIEDTRDNWPIEFDLLDYQPEPWQPSDSLAIAGEFRWYLTGRLYVICIPELVKRTLGENQLYRDFIVGEADEESILHPGEYPSSPRQEGDRGETSGALELGGSNNWVLGGTRTATGKPLVCSDPHVPFGAVSLWHEVRLDGGSFHVGGVALAGMPAVMIGRSRHLAWGITNNICSQRDLYQEKTDPQYPDCFLFDGKWEPARKREEVIQVKGSAPIRKVILSSRHGPIVDEILPPAAHGTGPVSLRWLGTEYCGWLPALLGMSRARTCAEFREATRTWLCPTFNLVYADSSGHIGFHTAGAIPIRRVEERGYRPGWDPQHQWAGLIPFEEMPHLLDPPRGYVVTANNRLAPPDFPYPLTGRWAIGWRCRRLREQLSARQDWLRTSCQQLQLDVYSGRAAATLPHLLRLLGSDPDPRVQPALTLLQDWDYSVRRDSAAAAIFNVFYSHWCRRVVRQRLPADQVDFIAGGAAGIAGRLLVEDSLDWFPPGVREQAVREAFGAALDELTNRLGPDMKAWRWGGVHVLLRKHVLSGRGELGQLLDRSGLPVDGDGVTVNSGTHDATFAAWLGASYRLVVDFAEPGFGMWTAAVASTSGHPGSPHYDDQMEMWREGKFIHQELDRD